MDMVPRGRANQPHCHLQTRQGGLGWKERPSGWELGVDKQGEEVTDKNRQESWGKWPRFRFPGASQPSKGLHPQISGLWWYAEASALSTGATDGNVEGLSTPDSRVGSDPSVASPKASCSCPIVCFL